MFPHRGQNNRGNGNDDNNKNGEYLVPGTDKRITPGVDCYNCGKPGRMSFSLNGSYCRGNRNLNILKVGYVFAQHNDKDIICKTWILVDTCSASSFSNNIELVMNVQAFDEEGVLEILMDGGSQHYVDKGTLKIITTKLHMDTKYMATILYFKGVTSILVMRITMDTANEISIILHWSGNLVKFTECDDGLYFFDTATPEDHCVAEDSKNNATNKSFNNYSMLNTISKNK